jgi:hypothetical protein
MFPGARGLIDDIVRIFVALIAVDVIVVARDFVVDIVAGLAMLSCYCNVWSTILQARQSRYRLVCLRCSYIRGVIYKTR